MEPITSFRRRLIHYQESQVNYFITFTYLRRVWGNGCWVIEKGFWVTGIKATLEVHLFFEAGL